MKIPKFILKLFPIHPAGEEVRRLERILHYRFENPQLMRRALTHRSILPETGGNYIETNEQLEFLGDAVLDLIVVENLCAMYPDRTEGELSKMKAMLVNGSSLQAVARRLKLGDFILMSDNEARNGGRRRSSILEDTFEALVAAIYLDGGYHAASNFVKRTILSGVPEIEKSAGDFNYKSQLLEYLQGQGLPSPVYRVINENGPDHNKLFNIEVVVSGKTLGAGSGHSKKSAQQQAARIAISQLSQ